MFLLKAYIAIHKFDIICILETYLDSCILSDDNNLEIFGYTLVRSDHPSNNKSGGVCIYYKSFLPLRILNVQYLQESICFELKIGDKTCNFLSLYKSPGQSQNDFETFIESLELNLESLVQRNPFLVVLIEDFNAKSSNWFCQDKTNYEGDAIENLTTRFGLHQMIKEPTHILDTSSSYIDPIFTSQPSLIIVSGVHSSLHSNCHHQIISAKFNLEVVYLSQYVREVWHYKDGNTELIRQAINEFNWQRAFLNINVNEKVGIFNSTILNILSNFIPHEFVVRDDKDPPWFNKKIRSLIQEKIINNKKMSIVPPLFYENRFITDFKEKAKLFNFFLFSKQCFLIPNNSSLPADSNYITDKPPFHS